MLLPALAFPASVLLVSFILLVREFGTWALLHVKVHESGRRDLAGTVLYYDHVLRELPIDALFAFAIAASLSHAGVAADWPHPALVVGFLACLVAWVFFGSIRSVGLRETAANLLQMRETDVRRGWGSHWQMHFLSTAALLVLLTLPVLLLPPRGLSGILPIYAVFGLLSVLFATGPKALLDRRWVLHGAREVLTYGLMTGVPMLVCLLGHARITSVDPGPLAGLAVPFLAVVAVYYLVVFLKSDLAAEASSSRGILFLLSSHFFEHTLDYVLILVMVMAILAFRSP